MIKLVEDNDIVYAKIITSDHPTDENVFFTEKDTEIQFGILNYKKNYKTGAHYHGHLKEKTARVDEILIFLKGSARIDFYNNKGAYIKSSEISENDIVIIYQGGHNISYTKDTKIYIIKPGIYDSSTDKTRIVGTNNTELIVD